MRDSNVTFVRLLILGTLAAILTRDALASEGRQHLLPVGANFDTQPPYGRLYANTHERLLFPASTWLIRYFQVIGDPAYDTGITVYERPKGIFRLMVKQARPAIGDIVMNAFYGRTDLQSSLALVKIKTSDREIPGEVAHELQRLWLSLTQNTRDRNKVDKKYYIHPVKVILWAKDGHGTALSGQYPPDAADYRVFNTIESIIDLLVKSCDAPTGNRARLLSDAAQSARTLRAEL